VRDEYAAGDIGGQSRTAKPAAGRTRSTPTGRVGEAAKSGKPHQHSTNTPHDVSRHVLYRLGELLGRVGVARLAVRVEDLLAGTDEGQRTRIRDRV
jgi:hypothetical protein